MCVHACTGTHAHAQGMAVSLHWGQAASNCSAKGGEVSHASASRAEGQMGLNELFTIPNFPSL